jgi:hypothetical protein|tara:strand:- start:3575 stop:3988 length:414 start_codon:yes stop_codon:yes gene_type:complete
MSHKINAHEFQPVDARSNMSIRTKVPKSEFDDHGSIIIPRMRGAGLSAGDHITVQIMNEKFSILLHECDFVICNAVTSRKRIELDDYKESTAEITTYKVARFGEWWNNPYVPSAIFDKEPKAQPKKIAENKGAKKAA